MSTEFWGAVPVVGRGSLPFSLIHGEALISSTTLALQTAGVDMCDDSVSWAQIRDSGRGVVLHDPLCPLTPPDFIAEAASVSAAQSTIVAGTRPVTDTVKQAEDGDGDDGDLRLGQSVDRTQLVQICSPLVLPPAVVEQLDEWPQGSFVEMLDGLKQRWPVTYLEAPALARRVDSEESVQVLEALSRAVVEAANQPG